MAALALRVSKIVSMTRSDVACSWVTPERFSNWIAVSLPAVGVPVRRPDDIVHAPVLDSATPVVIDGSLPEKSSVRVTVAAGGTICTVMLSIAPRDLFEPKPTRPQFKP